MTRLPNAALAESLHLRPDDEVLDVGCGAGVLLADRASAVCFVAGLDASAVQVGVARERLGSRISAGTAEVVQGDAAALPWEDGRPRLTPGCGVLGLLAHQEPGQGSEGCAGAAGPVNRP